MSSPFRIRVYTDGKLHELAHVNGESGIYCTDCSLVKSNLCKEFSESLGGHAICRRRDGEYYIFKEVEDE